MVYDYTVLAGTQGHKNHEKKDRFFELAAQWRLPVIAFAEGGGVRFIFATPGGYKQRLYQAPQGFYRPPHHKPLGVPGEAQLASATDLWRRHKAY